MVKKVMEIKVFFEKKSNRWVYKYKDSKGTIHKKFCRNCNTQEEAERFVSQLESNLLDEKEQYQIKKIAQYMFTDGSAHLQRLQMFGKKLDVKTIQQKRHYIELIIQKWGNLFLNELNFSHVEIYLLHDKHSGSWKNGYIETFCSIYDETAWVCNTSIPRPQFHRFARNSRKSDIFKTEELIQFFDYSLWTDLLSEYVLFYTILCCGLRLGEARAIKLYQFDFVKKILIVDGFVKRTVSCERTNYNKTGNEDNSKIRIVPLPDKLINLIKEFVTKQKITNKNEYVFARDNGMPFRQEYLETTFKRQLIKSKVKINNRKLIPHSLRYTYITRLRRYLPLDIVQQIVGHSNYRMTEYYTRFGFVELIVKLKDAFEKVNTILQ